MELVNYIDAICGICAATYIMIWGVIEYVKEEKARRAHRHSKFY